MWRQLWRICRATLVDPDNLRRHPKAEASWQRHGCHARFTNAASPRLPASCLEATTNALICSSITSTHKRSRRLCPETLSLRWLDTPNRSQTEAKHLARDITHRSACLVRHTSLRGSSFSSFFPSSRLLESLVVAYDPAHCVVVLIYRKLRRRPSNLASVDVPLRHQYLPLASKPSCGHATHRRLQ